MAKSKYRIKPDAETGMMEVFEGKRKMQSFRNRQLAENFKRELEAKDVAAEAAGPGEVDPEKSASVVDQGGSDIEKGGSNAAPKKSSGKKPKGLRVIKHPKKPGKFQVKHGKASRGTFDSEKAANDKLQELKGGGDASK